MSISACPVCGAEDPEPVFGLRGVPLICNQLWPDAESARAAPVGDIDLVICPHCALIWNRLFEPDQIAYAPGYENALHHSPKFRDFAGKLAAGLVADHDLAGGHAIEVGCGDGYMLNLMVEHGMGTATGFDPTMAGRETPYSGRPGVRIVPEYFGPSHLDMSFDAVLCRHVVEHLDAPAILLRDLRRAIGDRSVPLYIEVPNAGWLLESVSIWDVIYEHVTYWTAPAMASLFRRTGYSPVRIAAGYGGQFLMAESLPGRAAWDGDRVEADRTLAAARAFGTAATSEVANWRSRLSTLRGTAVIWGAGSKGISFANALGDASERIAALVDLNPRKHGKFAATKGTPVISPDSLIEVQPSLVLIANEQYREEVIAQVDGLGLSPDYDVISG